MTDLLILIAYISLEIVNEITIKLYNYHNSFDKTILNFSQQPIACFIFDSKLDYFFIQDSSLYKTNISLWNTKRKSWATHANSFALHSVLYTFYFYIFFKHTAPTYNRWRSQPLGAYSRLLHRTSRLNLACETHTGGPMVILIRIVFNLFKRATSCPTHYDLRQCHLSQLRQVVTQIILVSPILAQLIISLFLKMFSWLFSGSKDRLLNPHFEVVNIGVHLLEPIVENGDI